MESIKKYKFSGPVYVYGDNINYSTVYKLVGIGFDGLEPCLILKDEKNDVTYYVDEAYDEFGNIINVHNIEYTLR